MENIKKFEMEDTNNTSPLPLQCLCRKIIIEQNNLYLSPYKEDTFPNDYCNNINMLMNNNEDSISHEINNLDLVIGMEELDNFIQDLNIDPFSELDNFKELFERDIEQNVDMPQDIDSKVIEKDISNAYSKEIEKDITVNSIKEIFKRETNEKDVIVLNSEDSESEIDSVSLQSTASRNIQDEKPKITIEISPQIQYIANVNTDCCKKTKEDIIIIISDSESDDSCSGYHSSDFEFITEEEARADGFKNFNKTNTIENEVTKTVEETQKPSCSNNNEEYRQNHQIPVGEGYFDLFRGYHAPTTPFMFENKCMGLLLNAEYAGVGFDMRVLSRQIQEFEDDDEYKEEAEECAKKILRMYPRENRKRRRRFI
ncbi:uncharacterized protein LOC114366306 [Ostrinia furnacalis]|uniref:uncharacterized protein LOC114366306 n=1 Tax=Ostrinia furnacalis TaxID=93504 RepID=UPI00103DB257|nr:uncharacterized protein LOC114366306 [Ostrinia furnacalis]